MKTLIFELQIGKSKLKGHLQDDTPAVEFKRKKYDSLPVLLKAFADLRAPDHLMELAQVANFLSEGSRYTLIEDAMQFQREYRRRIWQERSSMSPIHPRLSDYGVFDVGPVSAPDLTRGVLTFFVTETDTGVPRKVSCSLTKSGGTCTYTALNEVE